MWSPVSSRLLSDGISARSSLNQMFLVPGPDWPFHKAHHAFSTTSCISTSHIWTNSTDWEVFCYNHSLQINHSLGCLKYPTSMNLSLISLFDLYSFSFYRMILLSQISSLFHIPFLSYTLLIRFLCDSISCYRSYLGHLAILLWIEFSLSFLPYLLRNTAPVGSYVDLSDIDHLEIWSYFGIDIDT
jgi:hypothetical protein